MENIFTHHGHFSTKGQEEYFIETLLHTVPNVVYIYDLGLHQYLFFNDKITTLFGYEPSFLLGKSAEETKSLVHQGDWEVLGAFWEAIKQNPDNQVVTSEYRLKDKNRRWHWIRDDVQTFKRNADGNLAQIIGVITDITAQKDAESDIKKFMRHYTYHTQLLNEQNQVLADHEKKLMAANEELVSQQEDLKIAFNSLSAKNKELDETNETLTKQKNEMSALVKELSDRNFELDQFVYKISHDIRSPFTSILGLVSLMKVETDPERLLESVKHIEKSVLRLDVFVKSMLNFARISRENQQPEEIYFHILIDECLNDLKYLENFSKIVIEINVNDKDCKFFSDTLKINSIFRNIISNAVKYSNPYATEQSYLVINIDVMPTIAHITFEDNGIGIKEEYLNKIFGMFVRATERSDGSGLGLYIVKQSVERLNGTIDIKSKYGEGTIMQLSLPNMYSTMTTY